MLVLSQIALIALLSTGSPEISLNAEISTEGTQITGQIKILQPILLPHHKIATYPRVLKNADGRNDVDRLWFYPNGFSPARMQLWQNGQEFLNEGAWQAGLNVKAEQKIIFSTRVPNRNGIFGKNHDGIYLLSGWHPAPGDGEAVSRSHWYFEIKVPEGFAGFIGHTPFGLSSPRLIKGEFTGLFVPVFLSRSIHVEISEQNILMSPEPLKQSPLKNIFQTESRKRSHELLKMALQEGHKLLHQQGLSPSPLIIIKAPLRERLVEVFDGGVAISDRLFMVLDDERFMAAHKRALWRAQFYSALLPLLANREKPSQLKRISELVAYALLEPLAGDEHKSRELLEKIAVIPEIELLVYAPQIPFARDYFSVLDERPAFPRQISNAFSRLPNGKLLYAKLAHRFGTKRIQNMVQGYLSGPRNFEHCLNKELGSEGATYYRSLFLPPVPVDYGIAKIEQKEDGTHIQIDARGTANPNEALEIEAYMADGEKLTGRRIGVGEIILKTDAPPERLVLDPRYRVSESYLEGEKSPRFNNQSPPKWRFLLNNITGLLAVTDKDILLTTDFSLHRDHDPGLRFDFFGRVEPASYQLAFITSYGVGSKITPLRRSGRAGISLGYSRLRIESPGQTAGNFGSATLYYRYDSRQSPYYSMEGTGFEIHSSALAGRGDDGATYQFAQAGAGLLKIFPISFSQALLFRLRADWMEGSAPAQNGFRLGGTYRGLRGYALDELRGDRRAIASVEHRHVYYQAGNFNLFGIVTWTRLEGAFFADAAWLRPRESSCTQNIFGDVGYGLRFIGDVLNVLPAEIAVDMGVPLVRCDANTGRSPVTLYVSFVQSMASF